MEKQLTNQFCKRSAVAALPHFLPYGEKPNGSRSDTGGYMWIFHVPLVQLTE
jgi:hypothetical protein